MAKRQKLLSLLAARQPPVDDPLDALASSRVLVDGAVVTNPDSQVRPGASIVVLEPKEPAGVRKLGHALDAFDVDVRGRVGLDVGACTGGFTMALLERGATVVHSVEVGFGQLLGALRQDPRVVNHERTNVAQVTPALLGGRPDVIVVDVSNLPLREAGRQLAANDVPQPGTVLVGLVKPLFELRRADLPTDPAELAGAVALAADGLAAAGWDVVATRESEVVGHHGAVEFFVHAVWPTATR